MGAALDQLPKIITASRTDAIYNCHAYLTKLPIAAISPFIESALICTVERSRVPGT